MISNEPIQNSQQHTKWCNVAKLQFHRVVSHVFLMVDTARMDLMCLCVCVRPNGTLTHIRYFISAQSANAIWLCLVLLMFLLALFRVIAINYQPTS